MLTRSRCITRGVLALVWLIIAGSSTVLADTAEWPNIRGPEFDAHIEADQIHLPWPADGPTVLWRRNIGQGYSGFAVDGDRLYSQAQDHSGQYLIRLDLETGRTLWKTRYEPAWDADLDWPGPYATPTISGERVYFVGCYQTIGCADAESGELIWTFDAEAAFDGKGTGFGHSASAIVVGDLVVVPVGGRSGSVIALDRSDGSLVWATGDDPTGYTPSLPITVEGRRQVISFLQKVLVAHDPINGQELWRHQLKGGYNPHPSWPLYSEPYLFYALAFRRGAKTLRLSYKGETPVVEELWASDVMSHDLFSSVLHDGFVYGFDIQDPQTSNDGMTKGEFKCIDLVSGEERWSTAAVGGASVLVAGTRLVIFDERARLIIADADPGGYQERQRAEILPGEISWTLPSFARGRLLVRGTHSIAAVYLGDPAKQPTVVADEQVPDPYDPDGSFQGWIDRHHNQAFWLPSIHTLFHWFVVNLLLVLMPAFLLALPVRHRQAQGLTVLIAVGMVAGLTGFPVFTELANQVLFTWPSTLFLGLLGLVLAGVDATENKSRRSAFVARSLALIFAVLCGAYFLMCQRMHFLAGWGFLAGLAPTWPLMVWFARRLYQRRWAAASLAGVVAFSVFFWLSALVYLLKAHN